MLGVVERVCTTCARASAQYRCPSCNAPYCSAACFGRHDARCTEAFYKRCVAAELPRAQAQQAPAGATADARRVLAMVRADVDGRSDAAAATGALAAGGGGGGGGGGGAAEDDDDGDAALLAAALDDVALIEEEEAAAVGDAVACEEGGGAPAAARPPLAARTSAALSAAAAAAGLGALSAAEQRQFLRAAASGALSAAVARDWSPWWLPRGRGDGEPGCAAALGSCALLARPPLPPLRTLLRVTPAAAPLAAGVAGVALAYVFLQRLYVGDWEDESPQEVAALLLHLCPTLAPDARHADVAEVLAAFALSVQAPGLVGATPRAARAQVAQARRDAAALLGGPTAVLVDDAAAALPRRSHFAADALLHCQAALERAAAAPAAAARPAPLLRAARKLHFLAAWCADAEAAAEGALAAGARELLAGGDGGDDAVGEGAGEGET